MPRIDPNHLPHQGGTTYPPEFAGAVAGRRKASIAKPFALEDFGVSHVVLAPGAASSQRHWHEEEDELVVMLEGEAVLVDEDGRHSMRPGDIAVFPKNDANGHHLINESEAECRFVAIGRPPRGICHYADIDMIFADQRYTRKDGSVL